MANGVERDDDALFVENGVPVKFCFHTSITEGRKAITRSILRHGGQVVPSERDADVLLIDSQQDLALFRRRYYHSKERYRLGLYVESRGFVQRCIRINAYTHDKPALHKMPGVARGAAVGRARVPFTEEDRENLVHYLATKLPTRDGRMGNKAYQELEEMGMGDDPAWAWVTRHTWHSWREHYKINAAKMDERIDAHVKLLENVGHHLGRDLRRRRQEEDEEEDDDDDEETDTEEERQRVARQDHRGRPAPAAGRREQAARGHLARREPDLVSPSDEGEEEPPHREHPEKRARSLEVSSGEDRAPSVKAVRTPPREEDSSEDLGEIIGDDLFGEHLDENEAWFNYSNDDEVELPQPFIPSASPVPGQNGAPPSTQATLVAQSPVAHKERPLPSSPMKAVETSAPEQTVVAVQQRVASRSRVRTSAQRAPSVPRETTTRSGTTAVDAPYRNTRARSRSVDPEPQLRLGRESRKDKGKGKTKEVFPLNKDVLHEEVEEDIGFVPTADDGLSREESLGDEQAVEELLEEEEAVLVRDIEMVQEVNIGEPSSDEDGDADIGPRIESRHQDVDMGQPSDSDDAETHGSLVREAAGATSEEEQDENDMVRLQHASFLDPLAPVQRRITRSKSRVQTVSPHRAQTGRVASGPSLETKQGRRVQVAARKKHAV